MLKVFVWRIRISGDMIAHYLFSQSLERRGFISHADKVLLSSCWVGGLDTK